MSEVTAASRNHHGGEFVVLNDHISNPTGHMPPETEERKTLGLSPAQVAGSALAAVSGALLASFAGTTGTIIGTAIGSVVATVGAALYTASLTRTSAAVRRTAAQVRQTGLVTTQLPRARVRRTVDETSTGPVDRGSAGAADEDLEDAEESPARRVPWGKALLASLGVAVVALGGITAVEAVTGQPISSWFGGDATGTSVGHLVGTDKGTKSNSGTDNTKRGKQATTPSQTPSPGLPSRPATATQTPTEVPSAPPQQSQAPVPVPSTAP